MQSHIYSNKYSPKNRVDNGLNVVEVEIVDSMSSFRIDLNRAAIIGYTRHLPVTGPIGPSDLSGEPGFLYRNSDGVQVHLTADEIIRLFRRDLRPLEVLKLLDLFGAFHEIHDDFYDQDTGESLQPMEGEG